MKRFLDEAANQNHPLRILSDFLKNEESVETAKRYDESRFVGYVLDIGYDEITIITCDPFKVNVGGVPRNSLLIMVPDSFEQSGTSIPPHFTLLRVLDSAPTPLTKEVQQTYFELQKKSMPELDIFTQSELQWGALKTQVLGMFYPHPTLADSIEFSGDLNNYVSAHKYKIYSPDDKLLDLVSNEIVPKENRFPIGKLRLTECRLPLPNKKLPDVDIFLSTNDFKGTRTAMFGKTRLGKSNVVKLIAQSLIETTKDTKDVGQLIFDIDGEYANDNPQNASLKTAFPDKCVVYALEKKDETESKELKINFYENPKESHKIIRTLLREQGITSIYIQRFFSVDIPSIEQLKELDEGDKKRAIRKIQIYWSILKKAGFVADENKLKSKIPFGEALNKDAMKRIFGDDENKWLKPNSLDDYRTLYEKAVEVDRVGKLQSSTKGKNLFDADDEALLNFLQPSSSTSAGPGIIQNIRKYHSSTASNFIREILIELDKGLTVIIDLGNADEEVMLYFTRQLSEAVFYHQTDKFSNNKLKNELGHQHFVQIYFEEAHNLFGINDNSDETKIYRNFSKQGAKRHIGMVYSTQSPSTMNGDLLAQTENFFVAHLASQDDTNKLAKINIAYDSIKSDILQAKTQGYMRMLTRSHRFVVPLQAKKFVPPSTKK
ncbi:MAG: helicase HerA domain-containing protein [Chitinophagaceae bacterium]